jgi:hypothetical protein
VSHTSRGMRRVREPASAEAEACATGIGGPQSFVKTKRL